MVDNRVLVPLRGALEPLGAALQWDGERHTVTATKGSTIVTLKLGSIDAAVQRGPR